MKKYIVSILCTCLLAFSSYVSAEGGCPDGLQPYQPPGGPWSCMPTGAGTGDRYVTCADSTYGRAYYSTAVDFATFPKIIVNTGEAFFITRYDSKDTSIQRALKKCEDKGGTKCEVINTRTMCQAGIAIAANNAGYASTSNGKKRELEKRALKNCNDTYAGSCKIIYSSGY